MAELLRWISPDCERAQWVRILMAVKAALGENGMNIADAWSKGSDRYQAVAFRDTWRSIREGGGVGIGTLAHLAREGGYRPDGPDAPHRTLAARRARTARGARKPDPTLRPEDLGARGPR
jgi:putative DNA primase/helicase